MRHWQLQKMKHVDESGGKGEDDIREKEKRKKAFNSCLHYIQNPSSVLLCLYHHQAMLTFTLTFNAMRWSFRCVALRCILCVDASNDKNPVG